MYDVSIRHVGMQPNISLSIGITKPEFPTLAVQETQAADVVASLHGKQIRWSKFFHLDDQVCLLHPSPQNVTLLISVVFGVRVSVRKLAHFEAGTSRVGL